MLSVRGTEILCNFNEHQSSKSQQHSIQQQKHSRKNNYQILLLKAN